MILALPATRNMKPTGSYYVHPGFSNVHIVLWNSRSYSSRQHGRLAARRTHCITHYEIQPKKMKPPLSIAVLVISLREVVITAASSTGSSSCFHRSWRTCYHDRRTESARGAINSASTPTYPSSTAAEKPLPSSRLVSTTVQLLRGGGEEIEASKEAGGGRDGELRDSPRGSTAVGLEPARVGDVDGDEGDGGDTTVTAAETSKGGSVSIATAVPQQEPVATVAAAAAPSKVAGAKHGRQVAAKEEALRVALLAADGPNK